MADSFEAQVRGLDSPAGNAFAVTPSDTVDFTQVPRAIYVGVAGNLAVQIPNAAGTSAAVTFVGVAAGAILPIRPTRVNSTNTTASSIVALF